MATARNDLLEIPVKDLALAVDIRQKIMDLLAKATLLQATWHEANKTLFALYGVQDSVKVTVYQDGEIFLMFGHRVNPAYNLRILPDNSMKVIRSSAHIQDSPSRYAALLSRLALGPAERTVYGFVRYRTIGALFIPTPTFYENGNNYPATPSLYIRPKTTLHRSLRTSNIQNDANLKRWFADFWNCVKDKEAMRIGDRIQRMPSGVWLVRDGYDHYISLAQSDGDAPNLQPKVRFEFRPLTRGQQQTHPVAYLQADIREKVRP